MHFSYRNIYSCVVLKRRMVGLQGTRYKNRPKIRGGGGVVFLIGWFCLVWGFFSGIKCLASVSLQKETG